MTAPFIRRSPSGPLTSIAPSIVLISDDEIPDVDAVDTLRLVISGDNPPGDVTITLPAALEAKGMPIGSSVEYVQNSPPNPIVFAAAPGAFTLSLGNNLTSAGLGAKIKVTRLDVGNWLISGDLV